MAKYLCILLSGFFLAGCNGTVGNYVGGAKQAPPSGSEDPPPASTSDTLPSVRISPGYMNATNNGVGLEANITPTKRVITGGGISAEITMGRTRSH
jgi:hypothetical protein